MELDLSFAALFHIALELVNDLVFLLMFVIFHFDTLHVSSKLGLLQLFLKRKLDYFMAIFLTAALTAGHILRMTSSFKLESLSEVYWSGIGKVQPLNRLLIQWF